MLNAKDFSKRLNNEQKINNIPTPIPKHIAVNCDCAFDISIDNSYIIKEVMIIVEVNKLGNNQNIKLKK